MQSDWIMGLAGGLLIGTAAAIYLMVNGRIMGASGIIGGLADGTSGGQSRERLFFVLGLIAFPALLAAPLGRNDSFLTDNMSVIIISGLMVGIGTRLANGCTSGHGVCGMSRLSMRGFVATAFYIGAGAVTMLALRHGLEVI